MLLLAQGFLEDYLESHTQFKGKRLGADAVRAILEYPWPGNVRELKSTVERAVLIADGDEIGLEDLLLNGSHAIRPWAERTSAPASTPSGDSVDREPIPTSRPASWDDLPLLAVDRGAPVLEAEAPSSRAAPQLGGDGASTTALVPTDEVVPLDELKRRAVARAFQLCEGNVERAAGELGIGRATMYRLLKKYDISTE